MLAVEEWMDVKMLFQEGHSVREIARQTGHSRNTVRKILEQKAPKPFGKPVRTKKLDPYKEYVEKRYQECGLSSVRLLEEIRPMGYLGSLRTLRRFMEGGRVRRRALSKLTVRFESAAGQQGQADWGYCGRHQNQQGEMIPVYVFVMVLGFSRMQYVQFTTSMDAHELIECHIAAFEYFGGWPREMLYDNMAQVKLPGGEWNPLFLDFAGHYGFTLHLCRVRRPRTKGKVERMVGYVKDNFLNGRSFADLSDLNSQGRHWLDHTANVRCHGATGKRPVEMLAKEGLTALNSTSVYRLSEKNVRKVDVESYVHLACSRYSVPPEHVGKTVVVEQVVVEQGGQRVVIRLGDVILAEHPKAPKRGSCMVHREHVEALWRLSGAHSTPCKEDKDQRGDKPAGDKPAGEKQAGEKALEETSAGWSMTFRQEVDVTPLQVYDAILCGSATAGAATTIVGAAGVGAAGVGAAGVGAAGVERQSEIKVNSGRAVSK